MGSLSLSGISRKSGDALLVYLAAGNFWLMGARKLMPHLKTCCLSGTHVRYSAKPTRPKVRVAD